MTLEPVSIILAICRLDSDAEIPAWAMQRPFFSISKTADELSIVCDQNSVPPGVEHESGWQALKVQGPLDLSLTGILASLANPLASAGINIFAISTFETDYLLVKENNFERAIEALTKAGHRFTSST